MSHRSTHGYTLVEILVTMALIGIVSTVMYSFIINSTRQYLGLQQDQMAFGDLALQAQRVANVVRGLTDVSTATNTELKMYSYFSPKDSYVSEVRYYRNPTGTALLADVTPMTANPPNGTLITGSKQTYTIISNLFTTGGVNTFDYLDASGTALTMPISDLHTIKGVKITLAVPSNAPSASNTTISLQVTVRNRKTNL